jgi:hypothetical protein
MKNDTISSAEVDAILNEILQEEKIAKDKKMQEEYVKAFDDLSKLNKSLEIDPSSNIRGYNNSAILNETMNSKENKYNLHNIISKIIDSCQRIRMEGRLSLDKIAEYEENEILKEGYKEIANNKFYRDYNDFSLENKEKIANWESFNDKEYQFLKEKEEVKAITEFVRERCIKHGVEDKKAEIVMITGLYAINTGWNPKEVKQFYDFIENYNPDKIDFDKLFGDKQKLLE